MMSKMWNIMKNHKALIMLFIVIIIFIIFGLSFPSDHVKFNIDQAKDMSETWIFEENGQDEIYSLPVKLDVPTNQNYSVTKILNNDFNQSQVLLIRSSLQDIKVILDDVVIYEKSYQKDGPFPPYASMWHLVELPGNSSGLELKISLISPYQAMSGQVNAVYYGTHAELFTHLIQNYAYRLVIGLLILLGGLFMMIFSMVKFKNQNKRNTYLGLFMVFISLWIIAESRMIQFILGSQFVIGSLAYFMLALFPIPIMIYLKDYIIKDHKKLYSVTIAVFSVQSLLILVMHGLNFLDFFESVIITQAMLTLSFLMVIVTLLLDIKKHDNKDAKRVFRILIILVIFGLFELVNFLINNFESTSLFLLIGVSIVFGMVMYNYISYIRIRLRWSHEKEIYEKLAYVDQLTGGYNRMAFERDVDKIFTDDKEKENLSLIFFDLDDLKTINDTYGHLVGDQMIQDSFHKISEILKDLGICYRIGGDEFACLIKTQDQLIIDNKIVEIEKSAIEPLEEIANQFSLSMGIASYDQKIDFKPSDLVKRADDQMYQYKKQKKTKHIN